jgi:hypothetical protein
MMEQQFFGGVWRIYCGLMWNTAPSPNLLGLPAVASLKEALQDTGFKSNENFLGWQWTAFHPRRKDFLLNYAAHPKKQLDAMEALFKTLLIEHSAAIAAANTALNTAPRSVTVSVDQLRGGKVKGETLSPFNSERRFLPSTLP